MAIQAKTVLVVEDEPLIRLSLLMTLEDAGYDTVGAGTVLEAVALMSRRHMDALVTDVDMPGGLSGLDLVDLVAAVSSAAIIVVSGRPLPVGHELPEHAVFMSKPYLHNEVVAELASRLGARELVVRSA